MKFYKDSKITIPAVKYRPILKALERSKIYKTLSQISNICVIDLYYLTDISRI